MVSAQTYLKQKEYKKADVMLDSLYVLLNDTHSPNLLHLDFRPVLDHYIQKNNKEKVQQYVQLMYQEQQAFKEQKLKQSNDEKDRISQEIKELLHPLFLHRLREKVPTVTRRFASFRFSK